MRNVSGERGRRYRAAEVKPSSVTDKGGGGREGEGAFLRGGDQGMAWCGNAERETEGTMEDGGRDDGGGPGMRV